MKQKTKKQISKAWDVTVKVAKIVKKNIEDNLASQYYETTAFCFNCLWKGKAKVPRGIKAVHGLKRIKCENCGCYTLWPSRRID